MSPTIADITLQLLYAHRNAAQPWVAKLHHELALDLMSWYDLPVKPTAYPN